FPALVPSRPHESQPFAVRDGPSRDPESGKLDPMRRPFVVPDQRRGGTHFEGAGGKFEPSFSPGGGGRRIRNIAKREAGEQANDRDRLRVLQIVLGQKSKHPSITEKLRGATFASETQRVLPHLRRIGTNFVQGWQPLAPIPLGAAKAVEEFVEGGLEGCTPPHLPVEPPLLLPSNVPQMPADGRKIRIGL